MGETLLQAKEYEEAEKFYLNYIQPYGWQEDIARSLAITYEALGKKEKARGLFGKIMDECRDCHCQIDPFIK